MNTSYRIKMAVGAALVIAGAAIFGLFAQREDAATGAGIDRPAPSVLSAALAQPISGGESIDQLSGGALSRSESQASPVDSLDRTKSVRDLDAELMGKASAGDTKAMYALGLISDRCAPFWSSFGDRVHPRHELKNVPVGSPERAAREVALKHMTAYCNKPYAPGELMERDRRFSEQLKEAAKRGDLAAKAATVFEGQSEAELVSTYLEADDPWIAERALFAFTESKGPLGRQIDAAVFPAGMRLASRDEISLIKGAAARWQACTLGRACGPNQYDELAPCLYSGNCGLGLSVQAHIQQRQLSGYQFELMQKYLAALRAKLNGG